MRTRKITVNATPKIQSKTLTINDHCIIFKWYDLRIPLQLSDKFSYLHHRILTTEELGGYDKIFITPDSTTWNPHCESVAKTGESMLNFERNMKNPRMRLRLTMEPEEGEIEASYAI